MGAALEQSCLPSKIEQVDTTVTTRYALEWVCATVQWAVCERFCDTYVRVCTSRR